MLERGEKMTPPKLMTVGVFWSRTGDQNRPTGSVRAMFHDRSPMRRGRRTTAAATTQARVCFLGVFGGSAAEIAGGVSTTAVDGANFSGAASISEMGASTRRKNSGRYDLAVRLIWIRASIS